MKKRKKSLEPPQMRAERLQFTKCMQTKSIKSKKIYSRKGKNQKILPFLLVKSGTMYLYINDTYSLS